MNGFNAETIKVNSMNGRLYSKVHASELVINKNKGRIFIDGEVNYLTTSSNHCNIDANIDASTIKSVDVSNYKGNIDVYLIGADITPKIGSTIFHKVNHVDKTYKLLNMNKDVKLKIDTHKGKIYFI